MMLRRDCTILVALVACSCVAAALIDIRGMRGCPYSDEEFRRVALRFADAWPDAFTVLDRTDVVCVDAPSYESYGQNVAGETLWPGTEFARARIKIAADLETWPTVESGATVHEFMHLALWDLNKDPCYEHEAWCGWDEVLIEQIRAGE